LGRYYYIRYSEYSLVLGLISLSSLRLSL